MKTHNRMGHCAVSSLALFIFIISCCQKSSLVIEYGPHAVSVEEVREAAGSWGSVKDLSEFRRKVIEMALNGEFSRRARDLDLAKDDAVLRSELSNYRRENLSLLYVEKVLAPEVEVTEEDYGGALTGRVFEDTARARLLLVKDPALIDDVERDIASGDDFFSLLDKYGTETGKRTRGNIGIIKRSSPIFDKKDIDSLFRHEPGDLFGPLHTQIGEVFIYLEEIMTAEDIRARNREKIEPELRRAKVEGKIQEKLGELMEKFDVTVYGEGENEMRNVGGKFVRVAAQVGNVIIAHDDIAPGKGRHPSHPEVGFYKKRLMKELRKILFMMEAEEIGLDEDEDYKERFRKEMEGEFSEAYKRYILGQPVEVTDKELGEFFEKHKEELFYKYQEVSYFVLKGVPPSKLQMVRDRAAQIGNRQELEKASEELGLKSAVVLRKRAEDIPERFRGEFMSRAKNDIVALEKDDGSFDVHTIIAINLEESFPRLDDIRESVRDAYINVKRVERQTELVESEIKTMKIDERKVRELYGERKKGQGD
ncbi:MAG: hypothetical protein GTO08_11460 [Deltaproteobacteria bacterium]|nr:hypothetical protein [Deltaproteobacteria bacterium]